MAEKPLIVANWKSNKTIKEALKWLKEFQRNLEIKKLRNWEKAEIVICPPFTALQALQSSIINHQSSIKLGAQNISPFPNGPYTGEISAQMLSGLVDYVLVGHSERRKHLGETTKMVSQKVEMAQKANIIPIICAADIEQVPKGLKNSYVMYEPPSAISQNGVYRPNTPKSAQKTLAQWKSKLKNVKKFLYGGSVNPQNSAQFLSQPDIDGVVVGNASLDPAIFFDLITNVSS